MATNYSIIGEGSKNMSMPLTSSNKSYVGSGYYNANFTEYTVTGFTSGVATHFLIFGYQSQEEGKKAKFSINYTAANGGSVNCLTKKDNSLASCCAPGSGEHFLFSQKRYGTFFWVENWHFDNGKGFGSNGNPAIYDYFTKRCNGTYTIKDTVHPNLPVFKLHFNIQ